MVDITIGKGTLSIGYAVSMLLLYYTDTCPLQENGKMQTNASDLYDFIKPLGIDANQMDHTIPKAVEAIESGQVHILGFSGKKASGKDTFAGLFSQKLTELGKPSQDVPISMGIRAEATLIFAEIFKWKRNNGSQEDFLQNTGSLTGLTPESVARVVDIMEPLVSSGEHAMIDGWSRANEVTEALQFLGNEAYLDIDPLHWVRHSLWMMSVNASNGVSSLNPSLRFMHDADGIKRIGGYLIRLEVDPEKQAERLLSRDNVVVPPETLNHISETALDNYTGFDGIYENNGDTLKPVFKKMWADWAKANGIYSRV